MQSAYAFTLHDFSALKITFAHPELQDDGSDVVLSSRVGCSPPSWGDILASYSVIQRFRVLFSIKPAPGRFVARLS